MFKFSNLTAAAALLGALAFSAQPAFATPAKCQGALSKIANKWEATVIKTVQKCIDGIQKEVDKNGVANGKKAANCEKAMAKLAKSRTKIAKKCLKAKCDVADLAAGGHRISGTTATGGTAPLGDTANVSTILRFDAPSPEAHSERDFVCGWLILQAEQNALATLYAANPSATTQLAAAQEAGDDAVDRDDNPAPVDTPYLDDFISNQPYCKTHSAVLGAGSNATLETNPLGAIPLTLSGTISVGVCETPADPNNPFPTHVDTVVLTGGITSTIEPVSPLPGLVVCVTNTQLEGFCDCGAGPTAPGMDYYVCIDSDCDDGQDCSADTATNGFPVASAFLGAVETDVKVAPTSGNGDDCVTAAAFDPMAGSVDGDCAGNLGTAFRIMTLAEVGSDGTPCTDDDLADTAAANGIPFTTQTAQGFVTDADHDNGGSDGDFVSADNTGTAGPSTCNGLRSSSLSGLTLVGAGPTTDSEDGLPDNVISVELIFP